MKKTVFLLLLSLFSLKSFGQERPFVVGEIMGQLGNQYFQIATTVALALDHHATPIFPSLATQTDWNVPTNYRRLFSHLNVTSSEMPIEKRYLEPSFTYQKIPYQDNMSICGWFQSAKYFDHHRKEILKLFAPSEEIQDYLERKYSFLLHHPMTVAVHYRSYAKEDPDHKVYADPGLIYYKKAIASFPKGALFIVFSNDIASSKKLFSKIPRPFFFVENEPHYHDLHLMALCKHQIIANSSFSWWAAYLNQNPTKKVIAPLKWFAPEYATDDKDLIPESWIRL